MCVKSSWKAYAELRGERNYWFYLASGLLGRLGDSIDAMAYSWIAYQITGSAVWLTVIAGVNAIPTVVITPLVAPLVERMDKKRVMMVTGFVRAGLVLLTGIVMSLGRLTGPLLLVTTFLMSVSESFADPAYMACIPKLLPQDKLDTALALRTTVYQAAQLIGTGLAGVVLGVLGGGGALVADGTLFVFSTLLVRFLHLKSSSETSAGEEPGYLRRLTDGFAYFKTHDTLVFLSLSGVLLSVLIAPFSQLQTAYVADTLRLDAYALSVLGVGTSAGMLIGSVVYPLLKGRLTLRRALGGCLGAFAGAYFWGCLLSLLPGFLWLQYAGLLALGLAQAFALSLFSLMINVLFFRVIQEAYLSRMASLFNAMTSLSVPVASLLTGGLVSFLPVLGVFGVAGVLSAVAMLILPQIQSARKLDAMLQTQPNEKEAPCEDPLSTAD